MQKKSASPKKHQQKHRRRREHHQHQHQPARTRARRAGGRCVNAPQRVLAQKRVYQLQLHRQRCSSPRKKAFLLFACFNGIEIFKFKFIIFISNTTLFYFDNILPKQNQKDGNAAKNIMTIFASLLAFEKYPFPFCRTNVPGEFRRESSIVLYLFQLTVDTYIYM